MTGIEEIIELFRELEKVLDECSNNYSEAELQLINQESAFNKIKLIAYKYWFSDKKELTKYKRAFEILKNHNLSVGKNANTETGYYVYCESELLTDEYELIEELINNAKD